MPTERQRRAEVVRLIVTTRERFPHSPRIMEALRRAMWRYAAPLPAPQRRKRRIPKKTRSRRARPAR